MSQPRALIFDSPDWHESVLHVPPCISHSGAVNNWFDCSVTPFEMSDSPFPAFCDCVTIITTIIISPNTTINITASCSNVNAFTIFYYLSVLL